MSAYPTIDYSTLSFPDNSGGTTAPDSPGNTDGVLAQIGGLFDSIGTAAGTIIPAVTGPQPLAPGQSYVVGGRVVTTPSAGLGILNASSNGFLFMAVAAILVLYFVMRK